MTPLLAAPTRSARATADRLAALWPGTVAVGPEGFAAAIRAAFLESRPVIGVAAAGILIRILAPLLADKQTEPPVVAVAESGAVAVPLLGGHHGANDLARRIAAALGGQAAITTAGDLRFGVALDAPPPGWRLAPGGDAKSVMARLLDGAPIAIEGDLTWIDRQRLPVDPAASVRLVETVARWRPVPETLAYHPARLAIGVGCERGTPAAEIGALIAETLAASDLAPEAAALVASIDVKMDEGGLHAAAAELGLPVRFFDAARLEGETPRLANPSEAVFRAVGCHGVAEAAALAAAGPEGRLLVPKRRSARATCAIALAPTIIDPARTGRARGRLSLVGIGPGAEVWRTPEADACVREASDLVGYGLYLDLLGPLAEGRVRHDFPLGAEVDRVRHALDLAAAGRAVALVCSGDAGIYAMGSLVWEEIATAAQPGWARIEVTTTPGITAVQALAARAGAPLGHDFCLISLSDLMTPWPVIEGRIEAAARGDFVVAFYNPVSQRRRTQLARARAILLTRRDPRTPVLIGRNLGRPGERVIRTTLGALEVDAVDMLSVVLVGSSETRVVERPSGTAVYTPRGYAAKRQEQAV